MYAVSKLNTAITRVMSLLNYEVFETQPPETKISIKLSYNDRWFYVNCIKNGKALNEAITVNTKMIKYKDETHTDWITALDFRNIEAETDEEIINVIENTIDDLMHNFIIPKLNPEPIYRNNF